MRSRVFRCLVCLLVAAVMIVNLSPLYVQATSAAVTAVVVGVGVAVATAIALQALGVRQGSDPTTFQTLVTDCSSALSADWAANGLVNMLAVNDGILTKTYASQNFLKSILNWLFDSGSLAASEEYIFPYTDYENIMAAYKESMSHPYHYFTNYYTAWSFYFSDYPISLVDHGDGTFNISFTGEGGLYSIDSGGRCNYSYQSKGSGYGSRGSYYTTLSLTEITTASDLTLESVGQKIDTDYETYIKTGIVSIDVGVQYEDDPNTNRNEEDDNKTPMVPVAIPSLNTDGFVDQTQADAQSGLTDPDIIQQLLDAMNGSGNGSGTGDNTGSENWSPSDMGNFTLDLSRYFPFCIPFDLYDFFTCLNADPVAPVIEWVIPVPGGDTYPLEIDLSPFDPVAQLLRRLQLLLFCVGLAFKTRDLIKG